MSTGHTPAPSADPVQARKGQWLHRLLISFTGIGVLIMAFNLVGPSTQMTGMTGPNGAAVLALLGLTALNRRGQTTVAAAGLVGVIAGNIVAAAYLLPLSLAPALAYPVLFTVVIATAGVFLSWRVVLALVLLVRAVTSVYYLSSPAVPALVAYRRTDPDGVFAITSILIILFVVTGALAWLSNRLISETLADLQQRAAELAVANQALVVQSQQEAALGQNIGGQAAELTSVSTRQVTGVSQQARAISEAVATVASLQTTADEIAGIAQEVTRAAASAHASVTEAQGLVLQGRRAVEQNRQHVAAWLIQQQVVERALAHIIRAVQTIHDLADEAQLLAQQLTDLAQRTAAHAGPRLFLMVQLNPRPQPPAGDGSAGDAPDPEQLDRLLQCASTLHQAWGRPPTRAEIGQHFYHLDADEVLPPLRLVLSSQLGDLLGQVVPPSNGGTEDLYCTAHPLLSLTRTTLRAILYDWLFGRQRARAAGDAYSTLPGPAQARMSAWYQQHRHDVLGLGDPAPDHPLWVPHMPD